MGHFFLSAAYAITLLLCAYGGFYVGIAHASTIRLISCFISWLHFFVVDAGANLFHHPKTRSQMLCFLLLSESCFKIFLIKWVANLTRLCPLYLVSFAVSEVYRRRLALLCTTYFVDSDFWQSLPIALLLSLNIPSQSITILLCHLIRNICPINT